MPRNTFFLASLFAYAVAQSNLVPCLQQAGLDYSDPSMDNYAAARHTYNRRPDLQFLPSAVVFANNSSDISGAIKCAAANNVSVATRGGGHSYVADGIGGKNGSLVVDVSHINTVIVDHEHNTTEIGAGQRLGPIYLALNDQGRAISAGTCPGVGIGGHASCGGIGYSSRLYGMAIDQLVAVEAVLANGTISTITPESYPDIWFGLNGAGASFASIATYTFATFAAIPQNTGFNLVWHSSPQDAAQALLTVQQWANTSEFAPEFGMNFEIRGSGTQGLVEWSINGAYHASSDTFWNKFQSLTNQLPQPNIVNSINPDQDWLTTLEASAGGIPLNLSGNYETPTTFEVRSIVMGDFSQAAADGLMNYIAWNLADWNQFDSETSDFFVQLHLVGGPGSAYASVPTNVSSFARRDAMFSGQIFFMTSQAYMLQSGFDAANDLYDQIVTNLPPSADVGAYLCYSDNNVTDVGTAYYGTSLSRLQALKQAFDPDEVFSYPLGVPTA